MGNIDRENGYYDLLLKFVTYEQVGALKRAVEVLRDLVVGSITREVLSEGW